MGHNKNKKYAMKRSVIILILIVSNTLTIFSQPGFDGLALTPPMGWNSWNTFRLNIHEELVREIADLFLEKGLEGCRL